MECDGTDLGSLQGLKPGSGLDVECAIGKPRVEKMDGKILVKKKRLNQIGTGYNWDGDEPIGALFKLKGKRKLKKAKLDSGGKGKQVEVRPEKLVLKNEDLGCMEDTLASFKKKLKGPKKEDGSNLTAGRGMSNNAVELVGQSSNGPVEDAVLAAKSISNMVEKGLMTSDDVGGIVKKRSRKSPKENIGKSSKATSLLNNTLGVVEAVDVLPSERSSKKLSLDENECKINLVEKGLMTGDDVGGIVKKHSRKSAKEKSRRSKATSLRDDTVGVVEAVKVLHGERPGKKLSLDGQGCNLNLVGSAPCSDEHLEDSLFSFFQKAQSGSVRKSHSSLRSKEVKKNQASNDELAHGPNIVGDNFPLLTVRKQSASKLGAKVSGSDGTLHQVSHAGITDPTHHQNHILGHLKSGDRLSQGLKCREGGLAFGDPTQQPSSAPVLANKLFQASSRAHDGPSEGMLEDSVSVFSSEISRPRLKFYPHKTRVVNRASAETHEGRPEEPPNANHILDRGPDQFNCSKAREGCDVPSQDPTIGIHNVVDNINHCFLGESMDLVCDVAEMMESTSAQEIGQSACHLQEDVPTGGFVCSLVKHSKVVSAHATTTTEQKSSSPFRDSQVDSLGEAICSGTMKRISDKYSESPDPNLIANDEKIRVSLKSLGEFKFDQCQNDFHRLQHSSPSSDLHSPHMGAAPSHCPNKTRVNCNEDPDIVSVSSQKEDTSVSDGRLSPMSFGGHDKYESGIRVNHLGRSIDITDEEAPSSTPEQNETCTSDTNCESKDNLQQSGQRAVRNAKRHRHGDMAYEGDVDWEVLMQEPDFLVNHQTEDKDRPFRTKGKLNSLSTMSLEAESGGAAAVSAGLKAHAAGPVEKIKFKEVLKRKGGLQEYIECRNYILYLWNKDVTRILHLSECGVSNIAAVDEPPRISLLRDIYAFLDHCGYINVGVASEKETAVVGVMHNFRISEEKNVEGKSGAPLTDSDDGVSFILGSVKDCNSSMEEKGDAMHNNEDKAAKGDTDPMFLDMQTRESSTTTKCKRLSADDYQGKIGIDVGSPSKVEKLDVLGSTPCCHLQVDGAAPVVLPGLRCSHSHEVQPTSTDYNETQHFPACDTERRNKIIVIGAGPAGLTAARHLHRQGFDVTVLEARSRIGGRVFTDRSSLSVPVDLGASIITGVEADVSTERRPDPSSLVCQQLGIELSVLNSDCPLYDISTGKKVPADLDESLEAEYNSLLDDTLLLVAQKGEHAMKMSLEEGLEYALKMRRMARSGKRVTGSERTSPEDEILSPLERRVMDWHFANLEYGCAALLKEVSLPYWNQDDAFGGFGGAHCMIKGGYSRVVDSLGEGLCIHLNHVVTNVCYHPEDHLINENQPSKVKIFTSNGKDFTGDAVLITVPLGCLKAETIKFSPQLPQWKYSSIQRLGFGVLNKVVLEFSEVFWDDSVDYFGATADETDQRGWCFMFWNVKKTVGAPVLIALVVGKAAINGQNISSSDHVDHAIAVLRKIFGDAAVPDPMASIVTDWGRDPFSYGAYSYVAVGASGEDYDILGRPINNCLFFAGEATCKEHPDTVGGAMMSGLREAVRIIEILNTGTDCTAEVEAMEAAQRHSDSERGEVRDIITRLDAIEISNGLYKSSLDGSQILTREALLQDMFSNAKTTAGRLHLVKELLNLSAEVLKSFTGTKEGLSILNSWILDSLGKDGTQLLRHCVRLLVRVSTDLLAVRLSGIGKTVKEKVCVHTSRDIRAIASQLVNVWVEIFRKEKASSGGLKLLRQSTAMETSKGRSNLASGKPPLRAHHASSENRGPKGSAAAGNRLLANANNKKANPAPLKFESRTELKSEIKPSKSQGSVGRHDFEEGADFPMSEEEQLAFAAAETARAAAIAAAEAYASSGAKCNTQLQLPKIPSFHKFARREQYAQMDDAEFKRKWAGGIVGRQDNISEIDSRNTRVRDWSVDFSATGVNIESSKMSGDNHSQRSHSNENACQLSYREHSGESAAVDSSIFTKAWVDSAGSEGIKDYTAIDRWQSQAAAADSDFYHRAMYTMDEADSNVSSKSSLRKIDCLANESSASQVTINKELVGNQPRGSENIKQAVVDYVASLLMPLYKARKIDKQGYKSIMKKTETKVMEQTTDAEKAMAVFEFLDFKRKNKIRAFVDKLIERHMAMKDGVKC